MCARALLVFLVVCTRSLFLNAGRSSENSSQWVLMVLVLSCYANGYELEARAAPVDDRRPGTAIWLNRGVVPPPTPAVGHRLVYVNGRICFGSATPTEVVPRTPWPECPTLTHPRASPGLPVPLGGMSLLLSSPAAWELEWD